jgi:hypothetical protein
MKARTEAVPFLDTGYFGSAVGLNIARIRADLHAVG